MTAIHIFTGPGADAARHLVKYSALKAVVMVQEPYWYAGADSTKVQISTPRPSEGERLLWAAAQSFADGHGGVNLAAAADRLDADNRTVLAEACALALGVAADSAVAEVETKRCPDCRGDGRRLHGWAICPRECETCGGAGRMPVAADAAVVSA